MNYQGQLYVDPRLDQLTTNWNRSLQTLSASFKTKLNDINKMTNLSKSAKLILVSTATNSYNATVKQLTADYNKQKDALIRLIGMSPKKALLIGINYMNTSNELYGCINDTANIQQMLAAKFGYPLFTIMTDKTEKRPSKQNILDELTQLLVRSKSGDNLFFLYSGHGTNMVDLNKDEADGQDELIVPIDAIGGNRQLCIVDDELHRLIQTHLKKGVKLVMLFDSCFSGTIVDLKYTYLVDDGLGSNPIVNETTNDTPGQVFVISGCKDSQTSADAYVNYNNKNMYSGAMTYSFLNAINTDPHMSWLQLITHMRHILKTEGYDQIPQFSAGTWVDITTEKVF